MRGWAVILMIAVGTPAARGVQGQALPRPDSVIEIEPVHVRILRGPQGTGEAAPISVLTGAELVRGRPGAFLEEALRALPGIQIQNRFNLASGERLMIRGFGSRAQFGIRGVRVLVDGIPATLPDGQTAIDHLDIGGLARAEILRGPSSALYGNAAGGVLDLRSAGPTRSPSGSLSVNAGSHALMTVRGAASGPIGTEGGYRMAFQRFSFGGFRRDPIADDGSPYGGAERSVVNAGLNLPLGGGELHLVAAGLDMDARNAGSLSSALLEDGTRQAYRFNVLQKTREVVRHGQAGASWRGRLAGLGAEITAWGLRRDLDSPIPPRVIALDRSAGGFRALFQSPSESGSGRLRLGAGFEAELQRDARRNWENERGEKGALVLDQVERVRGLGFFGQARLEVSRALSLSGGLRYDRSRFRAEDRKIGDGDPDDSGVRTMHALSPSAGVVLQIAHGLEAFAAASRSFETPTTTELVNRPTGAGGFNPELEPQRGSTVEGGIRGRVGASWSLETTVFRTRLTGELVPFEVPSAPGRTFFRNAGASRHRGWEVAVDGRPSPAASLRVAYTHVDARFTDFVEGGTDHSGNRIPGLAPTRIDGRLALQRGRAFLIVRGLIEGEVPVDDENSAVSERYGLVDVRTGVDGQTAGRLSLSPFVAITNLFDRRYNAAVTVNAFGGRFFEPGPPRSFQMGLTVRWGG